MLKANSKITWNMLGRVSSISNTSRKLSRRNISIHWKRKDNTILTTDAEVGKTLLQVAHKYNIELEGACEGVWYVFPVLFFIYIK
jgi:hypothetical protein